MWNRIRRYSEGNKPLRIKPEVRRDMCLGRIVAIVSWTLAICDDANVVQLSQLSGGWRFPNNVQGCGYCRNTQTLYIIRLRGRKACVTMRSSNTIWHSSESPRDNCISPKYYSVCLFKTDVLQYIFNGNLIWSSAKHIGIRKLVLFYPSKTVIFLFSYALCYFN